jgi:hypothetical protein
MDYLGIDVHKQESQICALVECGDPVEQRIATSRERFPAVLGGKPKAKILIEVSTESEWVALNEQIAQLDAALEKAGGRGRPRAALVHGAQRRAGHHGGLRFAGGRSKALQRSEPESA